MDIAEVIKQSGLSASNLRYYEERGLITSCGRKGLRRQYHADVIDRLALISLARRAGFTLAEICNLLIPNPNGKKQLKREMLTDKAKQLDKQIQELSAIRKGLVHAANCPAPNHFECPSFLRLLKIATHKAKRS